MKKLLFALFAGTALVSTASCDNRNDVVVQQDNDTYSVAYDLKGVNLVKNPDNGDYEVVKEFNKPLVSSDVVLVYRGFGTDNSGNTMWQQLPRLAYSNLGSLDYDFYFSKLGLVIRTSADYDLAQTPQFLNNQTFRVVFVPASAGKKNIDYSDYYAVAAALGIKESNVKVVK